MQYYYNTNIDNKGNHEVHTETCSYLPSPKNRVYIGDFSSCSQAIYAAKALTGKNNFDGCYHCSNSCHRG